MTELTVVVMTRNRADELERALRWLCALPDDVDIVVADNGSTDHTASLVRERFPQVELIAMGHNAGVAARNLAVRRLTTPFVAFSDDDSGWAPGSLEKAVDVMKRHPLLGAVTAHVKIEPSGRDDPLSLEMRDSPVEGRADVPGIAVLGFLACATVVRRSAFAEVGGFNERLHFGGEEEFLATDLVSRGWEVRYMPALTVYHQPSTARNQRWRQRRGIRNALWFLWLRRPVRAAVRRSAGLLAHARPAAAVGGLVQAILGLPWVLRERQVVPPAVERQLRRLEDQQDHSSARQYVS